MRAGPSAQGADGRGKVADAAQLAAYFDGRQMPLGEAAKAMKEAGLESAGGFYDTERTFGGVLYRLDDHLARLYSGLDHTGIDPGMSRDQMAQLTCDLVDSNRGRLGPNQDFLVTQVVSVTQASPGNGEEVSGEADFGDVRVAIYCQYLDPLPFALSYGYGVRVITPTTYQVPPTAAPRRQVMFTLMNDAEGNVTECQGGNFMFVRDGRIKLPDRSAVLPGVSMKTVLELADRSGIGVDEGDYCVGDVYMASEAFVSSTRFCMLPVATINGLGIGSELPGPVTRRLLDAWVEEAGFDFIRQALDRAATAGMM